MWKRKWFFYISEASIQVTDSVQPITYSTTRKLFFASYWMIRWIHGAERLQEMSAEAYFTKEFGLSKSFYGLR